MSPRWHVKPQPLVDDFLFGYRRAGGPGRLYPAMQAVAQTYAERVGRLMAVAWRRVVESASGVNSEVVGNF